MIENLNTSEMIGQLEMADFDIQTGGGVAAAGEGYDAEGNLINPGANEGEGDDPEVGMLAEVMGDIARNTEALEKYRAKDQDEIRLDTIAAEINAITNHARVVLASAAIDIGKRLIEARGIVPHGRWTEWLAANVDYSERKAQQLMQLAEEFGRGELPAGFAGLGLSQMTALLAAPEDAREALAEKARDEGLSVRELQAEIQALKIEKTQAQMRIDAMNDQIDKARANVKALDEENQKQSQAIVDRDAAIRREREAARIAEAKAAAAESSANELRKLHSDAEDRAALSAQRASDAVNRANQTAKALAEARARIAELEAEAKAAETSSVAAEAAPPSPEGKAVERIVEVVPEAVKNELADLRRQLAEAQKPSPSGEGGPRSGSDEVVSNPVTAVARFRDSYKRLTEEFKTAEALIAEIVKDDAQTGHMYATAMVKSCRMMIERLGE